MEFNHEAKDDILKTGCVLFVTDEALKYDFNSDTIIVKAYMNLLEAIGKNAVTRSIDEVPDELRVPEKPLYVKDNVIVKILDIAEIKDYV